MADSSGSSTTIALWGRNRCRTKGGASWREERTFAGSAETRAAGCWTPSSTTRPASSRRNTSPARRAPHVPRSRCRPRWNHAAAKDATQADSRTPRHGSGVVRTHRIPRHDAQTPTRHAEDPTPEKRCGRPIPDPACHGFIASTMGEPIARHQSTGAVRSSMPPADNARRSVAARLRRASERSSRLCGNPGWTNSAARAPTSANPDHRQAKTG